MRLSCTVRGEDYIDIEGSDGAETIGLGISVSQRGRVSTVVLTRSDVKRLRKHLKKALAAKRVLEVE